MNVVDRAARGRPGTRGRGGVAGIEGEPCMAWGRGK